MKVFGWRTRRGLDWRRFCVVWVLALVTAGGTVWATTAAAVPVRFAVSGSEFRVSAERLEGHGVIQYASVTEGAGGERRPVAVTGIGRAEMRDLCLSAVAHTPLGAVTLLIRSAPGKDVRADDLVLDLEQLEGDLEFGDAQLGRDAASLDAGPGGPGPDGGYGQQARTLTIDGMRLRSWSVTAATFRLDSTRISVRLGEHTCF
ncbi:DUF6230 family protein [Streptomyces specialis]|uniref:DUF6230 family protein n=1 Tax=Streptomyces specialis TaxID=498367 RepID=UPI000A87D28A|nr:DUF6230 family protein [Streptomyces specialis]